MEQFSTKNNNKLLKKKYLPHNFLAEKIILSCLLTNSEIIETTLERLPTEAFYFHNHQEIYKVIQLMNKNQESIDSISLATFVQEKGLLDTVGGLQVLIELSTQTSNVIYIEDYIKLIKDKFIRRSLIKLGYKIINSSYITNIPLENILNDFETKLFNFNTEVQIQKVSNSAELLNEIFSDLKKNSFNSTLPGLSSGFYDLDSLTQGFQKSDLIIVAGRPSMGKTALSLNIALNVMKISKLPILFLSLEMSKEQIMYRFLSIETEIEQTRLRSGRFSQSEWIKINNLIQTLSKLPLFVDDQSYLTIQDLRSKIKQVIFEQNQLGLIIIDYLQLIQNSEINSQNRAQELSQITRSLKLVAREFNVPVLALSQLSRNVENRINKRPILSDLRESGSIEQDADLVLMLSREEEETSINSDLQIMELIIAKQRNGPLGLVSLEFDVKVNRFYNCESTST